MCRVVSLNLPSSDVPRLPSYGFYISQLVRFARCCTCVFEFSSKNLQITSKLLTQGYRYLKLRKTFGKFFRSYSELLSKFGAISFQENVSNGITHPVFYGDLAYKLGGVKGQANFISSDSKLVKRLRRRQYDPAIMERIIGLVFGPFAALYRSFRSVALWLTRRFDNMTGLVWTSTEATGSWSPPPLIVSRDSLSLWTRARVQNAYKTAYFNGCPYIVLIYYFITIYICEPRFYDLPALVGCLFSVSRRRIIDKFSNVCSFDYTAVAVSWKVEHS